MVSPGYVKTELSRNAITDKGAVHGVMDPSTERGYSAAWVAERVLEAMQRGDQEVKHHSLSCCHLIQFTMV